MTGTPGRVRFGLRRARRPAAWVLCLYAVAVLAAVGMLSRQQFISPVVSHMRVEVDLADAAGVVAGKTEVRMAGVHVGLVAEKRLVDGRPRLELALDRDLGPLYRDARAQLAAITPLQDMYLTLERGTPASGTLPEHGRIAAANTSVAAHAADILNAFNADQRAALTTLLDELGRGLPDGGTRLRTAFARLVPLMRAATDVTRELVAQRRELARAVHNLADLTDLLARRDAQLTRIVDDGSRTLGTLAAHDRPLSATLRALPATVRALDTGLARVAGAVGHIDPALRALRPAARALGPGLRSLRDLAGDARPALRALAPAARELAPLTATLAATAGALERAGAQLRPQLPAVDAFSATTVGCLDRVAAFLNRFVSANKLGGAKGTWWRTQVVPGDSTRRISACADGRQGR